MQINNITATNDTIYHDKIIPRDGAKVVKLRTFDTFEPNTEKIQYKSSESVANETTKEEPSVTQSVETSNAPEANNNQGQVQSETPVAAVESAPLPFTSEEVIRSKKDTLGIEAYSDIESANVNLSSYQNTRRLRVNEVVVGNANRERNINGIERVKQETPETHAIQEKTTNNIFDFGGLGSINKHADTSMESELNETEEEPKYDNVTKLDEWLNKETATSSNNNSDDKVLNEVNELQAKLNDNASSLATQKEILEQLRARIANNEALVRAKRQELEEENMNVTRELNDVLAEITKLTSLANEQEAFLGISNDDESYVRSRAA